MTNDAKVKWGRVLLGLAVVLAIVGFVLHDKAKTEAATETDTARYAAAFSGTDAEEVDADQMPATVAWVGAGLSLVVGAVFLAGSRQT